MPGEAPPQMIEIEAVGEIGRLWVEGAPAGATRGAAPRERSEIGAVGAIASLWLKRSSMPKSAASGQAPRSLAKALEAASHWLRMCLNIFLFHTFAITASIGMLFCCRKEWKPMMPSPTERSRMAA